MSEQIKGYEFIKEEYLKELQGFGKLFRHKKSGARVIAIPNEDNNKVFSIGFRTPPMDSTGVAHIIEHTILCGSKQFPAKDPFIELAKGSLNTFLNAMTYSDKTVYPVASCNEKDFKNLMHVYMDAVFYPNIYKKEEIFKQEGWHYELEDEESALEYNGVVYNEMKGAFSSPEQILFRLIQKTMFPDTAYGTESGGDPDCIPDLTYEQFLDFHRRYYHASNSYIYLYGDMDIEERLIWMDENYLCHFENEPVDSAIKMQAPFGELREVTEEYSISEEETEEEKTYLSYNTVVGTILDKELYMAFQVLDFVLLEMPGAPLKQALLDKGLGKDVFSSYDNGILQPVFSIVAKNGEASRKDEFVATIKEALQTIMEKGIDKKALQGAINYFEFRVKEADFGSYPKGLVYGLQILDSWLYDDSQPFMHICTEDTFAFLKEQVETGYYEELIEKYILNNEHSAVVMVTPKVGLTAKKEKELADKLQAYKDSLSKEEIQKLIDDTKKLHEYEETPSTKEEIEAIPLLSREDIDRKARLLYNEEKELCGIKTLHHKMYTNEIAYLKLSFDISDMGEKAAYLGLLSTVLGYVDTKNYSYSELSNEMNIHTGGIGAAISIYNSVASEDHYTACFEIRTKVLYEKLSKAMELIAEIMNHTIMDDEKRLREIIAESKSRLEMRMMGRGNAVAVRRAMAYFSESDLFEDLSGGVGYYDFIADIDKNFEERKTDLIAQLKELVSCIFRKDNLLLSITASEEGYELLEKEMYQLMPVLENSKKLENMNSLVPEQKNEGFKTPGQVQFVARCGSWKDAVPEYSGSFKVLRMILEYDYLWNNIRVKGGAYGCGCGFSYDGKGYFASFRDPNLKETDEIYKHVFEYVKEFEADERDITKYIIGTISGMDTPLNPSAKGARSFGAYMCGVDQAFLQKEREQILDTTPDIIRGFADMTKAIYDAGNICVVGSESKVEEQKELFKEVKGLLR